MTTFNTLIQCQPKIIKSFFAQNPLPTNWSDMNDDDDDDVNAKENDPKWTINLCDKVIYIIQLEFSSILRREKKWN